MAIVCMAFDEKLIHRPGFGYLVPSSAPERILGCVYDSSTFPAQNQTLGETRLSVMTGGAHHERWLQQATPVELEQLALESVRRHMDLPVDVEPSMITSRVIPKCIPQYRVGHHAKVANIRKSVDAILPQLTLIGNSFDGVGLADCISSAKRTALDFAQAEELRTT